MDWLWLLIFVGLMAVMHRAGGMGCCGGHAHGGGEEGREGRGGNPAPSERAEGSGDKGKRSAA